MSDSDSAHTDYSFGDPFAEPLELRSPARRLRGRLAAPVTLWTAWRAPTRPLYGGQAEPVGLTISSLLVLEGEPPRILGLVGPLSDLADAILQSGRFVVHVLSYDQRHLADRFAGSRMAPLAGPFSDLKVNSNRHGPVVSNMAATALARVEEADEVGYHLVVRAKLDEIDLAGNVTQPLVHYRGHLVDPGMSGPGPGPA
jgi:flavin reductase (DIM6/NTAB) family NADH-FMN oxidoreductase RutF